jgi:hypothetical protein
VDVHGHAIGRVEGESVGVDAQTLGGALTLAAGTHAAQPLDQHRVVVDRLSSSMIRFSSW